MFPYISLRLILLLGFSLMEVRSDDELDFDLSSGETCHVRFPIGYSLVKDPLPTPNMSIISSPIRGLHGQFIASAMRLLLDKGLFFQEDEKRVQPPLQFRYPQQLGQILDLRLRQEGTSHTELLRILDNLIKYSPHPSHPYHLDKRVAGLDPYGVAGDWMGATMSNLLVTYLVSPIWTLMERVVTKRLCSLLGWYHEYGTGVSTSGAGMANIMAAYFALFRKYPDVKAKGYLGIGSPRIDIFMSEHGSYSFLQGARHGGIGLEAIVKIKVDPASGQMSIPELRGAILKSLEEGRVPIMIVGTVGTPILGAVDNIKEITLLCKEFDLWCHLDAERGSGLAFSSQKRTIFENNMNQVDSVTFGTWMMALPYTSTFLLVKNTTIQFEGIGLHAAYVFTDLDLYDGSFDNGDMTIQTSRRPEIAKFWYAWRGRGELGLRAHVNYTLTLTQTFKQAVDEVNQVLSEVQGGEIKLVLPRFETPLVSFYFVPQDLRAQSSADPKWVQEISGLTEKIGSGLLHSGTAVVSVSSLPESSLPKFLTLALTNSALEYDDLAYILRKVVAFAGGAPQGQTPSEPLNENTFSPYAQTFGDEIKVPGRPEPKSWQTAPDLTLHQGFLRDTLQLILKDGLFFKRTEPPSLYRDPHELLKEFDFSLNWEPYSHDQLLEEFRKVIRFSPHWSHPYFVYQLATGLDPYAYVADLYSPVLNSPMLAYQDSPVFTLMENELLGQLRSVVYGSLEGDGLVSDGGSMSNQIAITMAKTRKIQELTQEGRHADLTKQFVILISEDGHYSTKKGGIIQGYGMEHTILVDADPVGKIDLGALEEAVQATLQNDQIPFLLVITTGTTIYGAIDPVNEMVDICQKYKMWCHVDGMFGGLVVMSSTHRAKLAGIERTDSFGVDLHKLLGAPMVMSCIVTPHPGILSATFALEDPIDYDWKLAYDGKALDNGDRHWQIDKRNNMFKFWLLWKAKGVDGMGQHVDIIMDNVQYFMSELKRRPGFQPMLDEFEVTNICFIYIPPSMRHLKIGSPIFNEAFAHVSLKIERALAINNVMNIVSQNRISKAETTFYFLKLVTMGSVMTKKDLNFILDAIEFYGKDLVGGAEPVVRGRGGRLHYRFEPFGNAPRDD